jgi:hypothetical protein
MGSKKQPERVVAVAMDRGYAVVAADALDRINARFELLARIAGCTTWGEYRALGHHEFDEDVWDAADLEEEPEDDESFDVNLYDDDSESSRFDRGAALEVATQDLFDTITDEEFPHDAVEKIGLWSFVSHERVGDVLDALTARGFVVEQGEPAP